MNEIPRERLAGLLAVHGSGLLGHPEVVEKSLREECPEFDREISLITLVLERTTSTELRSEFDPSDLASRLSQSTGVPEDELRWAAEGWFAAIHGVRTAPSAPDLAATASIGDAESGSPVHHGMMGARSGLSTGLLFSFYLALVALVHIAHNSLDDATSLALIGLVLASPLLGGVVGWLMGPVLGANQKELVGGVAGAVLGALGGAVCSEAIKPLLTPLRDPTADAIRRTTLGLTAGLVFGAAVGLLHGVIWKRLRWRYQYWWLARRYPYVAASEYEMMDEINRRAGI